jgi:hypothetical protein
MQAEACAVTFKLKSYLISSYVGQGGALGRLSHK